MARMVLAVKVKAEEDLRRVQMANSICLAAQVRVDILKIIASF
jgi:hypothetical protein